MRWDLVQPKSNNGALNLDVNRFLLVSELDIEESAVAILKSKKTAGKLTVLEEISIYSRDDLSVPHRWQQLVS